MKTICLLSGHPVTKHKVFPLVGLLDTAISEARTQKSSCSFTGRRNDGQEYITKLLQTAVPLASNIFLIPMQPGVGILLQTGKSLSEPGGRGTRGAGARGRRGGEQRAAVPAVSRAGPRPGRAVPGRGAGGGGAAGGAAPPGRGCRGRAGVGQSVTQQRERQGGHRGRGGTASGRLQVSGVPGTRERAGCIPGGLHP